MAGNFTSGIIPSIMEKIGVHHKDFSFDSIARTIDSLMAMMPSSSDTGLTLPCPNSALTTLGNYWLPIFIILPGVLIAIAILIKKVAAIVTIIPKFTGTFFDAFRISDDKDGYGYGWSPPAPSYGPPSHGYQAHGHLSRDSAVLNGLDQAESLYNKPYDSSNSNDPNYAFYYKPTGNPQS